MDEIMMKLNADPYILSALKEDVTSGDLSTSAILKTPVQGEADLICKQDGIVCGLDVFRRVFELLDDSTETVFFVQEGSEIKKGEIIGRVKGDMRTILTGERTALNFLQRMSGIATRTHEMNELLKDTKITLLDTRKTTPNNRLFEKYAVKTGGGTNHRYNLSDAVMLKDNHISAAGSIRKAVDLARAHIPFTCMVEVECETLDQVKEAVEAKADIIMLDNMDTETMKKAIRMIDHQAKTECSGNVTPERVEVLKDLDLDYISSGSIIYDAGILDLSLKNLHPIEKESA